MARASRWPRAVVFDLDGTLIDSVGDIADMLNDSLAAAGFDRLAEPTVATMVGGGARLLIERALAHMGVRQDGLVDRLHRDFEVRYLAIGAGRSSVFPGGLELIEMLRGDGVKLGICTNKPEAIALSAIAGLGLARSFEAIVGETSALPRKPHPAMVQEVLRRLETDARDAVMIGDTPADIDGATAAGVATIAVGFGYGTVAATDLGADAIAAALADIPGLLSGMAASRAR